jgi:hypothetical protein
MARDFKGRDDRHSLRDDRHPLLPRNPSNPGRWVSIARTVKKQLPSNNYLLLGVLTSDGKASRVLLEQHQRGSSEPEVPAGVPLADPVDRIELRIEGAAKMHDVSFRAGDGTSGKEDIDGSLLGTDAAGGFVGAVIGMDVRRAEAAE